MAPHASMGLESASFHLLHRYEAGESPEEIAADYDGVSVADVHGALAVAFDNPEEMRALEQAGQEAIERIRGGRTVDPTGST